MNTKPQLTEADYISRHFAADGVSSLLGKNSWKRVFSDL